jgi:hypothetical protein
MAAYWESMIESIIYQFARGDQQGNNPGASATLRAGDLVDSTLYYRNDLAFARDPSRPEKPAPDGHYPTASSATARAVSRGAQDQIAAFFASDGAVVIHPEPAAYFEVPIEGALPETLHYIP